nr:lipoxygenase 3, chloroplastic-like [Tanacetum cinerariifolium]
MLAYFSCSRDGMTTLDIAPKSRNTPSIDVGVKRSVFKVPVFLSSGTNKLKTGCSQQIVKASLASATDFLEEEVKGDVSSSLKVTATVSVRIRKEMDVVKTMMKLPWLYPQNNSLYC